MLDSVQIANLVSGNVSLSETFLGVYSLNALPDRLPRNCPITLIVNTDTSNLAGQHWIAIWISPNKIGEVFDSYGRLPPARVQRWMNIQTRMWTFNRRLVQSYTSTKCGAFCLFYLYHKVHGVSLKNIVSKFFPIFVFLNDYIVQVFIDRIF